MTFYLPPTTALYKPRPAEDATLTPNDICKDITTRSDEASQEVRSLSLTYATNVETVSM
jgi:hypothetical protein